MHLHIGVMVEADSPEEALKKTNAVMDSQINSGEFDYYSTDSWLRWENCGVPIVVSTDKEGVRDLYNSMKEWFLREIGLAREIFTRKTDEEIWGTYLTSTLPMFSAISWLPKHLMDEYGDAITSESVVVQ